MGLPAGESGPLLVNALPKHLQGIVLRDIRGRRVGVRGLPVPERRRAADGWAAALWGAGWFMLPNPAYGPSLQGGIDDIFPADKRWTEDTKDSE